MMRSNSSASLLWVFMLSVPSAPTTVTVLQSRANPRSKWSGSHGFAVSFSAQQNVYFPGCPCVARSISPGHARPTFCRIRRTARPIVAFAQAPCPRQFIPLFTPSTPAAGPLTITHTATGLVVAWIACRLNSGAAIPSTAASSKGRYSGSQPARTALIAMRSTVAAPKPGAMRATTSWRARCVTSSMRPIRSTVGGTTGRPSLQH